MILSFTGSVSSLHYNISAVYDTVGLEKKVSNFSNKLAGIRFRTQVLSISLRRVRKNMIMVHV